MKDNIKPINSNIVIDRGEPNEHLKITLETLLEACLNGDIQGMSFVASGSNTIYCDIAGDIINPYRTYTELSLLSQDYLIKAFTIEDED